jgi:hypothetical protein
MEGARRATPASAVLHASTSIAASSPLSAFMANLAFRIVYSRRVQPPCRLRRGAGTLVADDARISVLARRHHDGFVLLNVGLCLRASHHSRVWSRKRAIRDGNKHQCQQDALSPDLNRAVRFRLQASPPAVGVPETSSCYRTGIMPAMAMAAINSPH